MDIPSFENFQELYDAVENTACDCRIPAIEFENGIHSSILTLSNPCMQNHGCILMKRRNVFEIIDDSIYFEKTYPIDSLNMLIKKHYDNTESFLPIPTIQSK